MAISTNANLLGRVKAIEEGINFTDKRGDLKIGVINLMPFKDEVEYQFFSIFNTTESVVELEFLYPETHTFKNTSVDYIKSNYYPIKSSSERNYDGIIVTGAPVEEIPFEEVNYWKELDDFYKNNDIPSIYICWGAQGALYSKFGIEKYSLDEKLFGVYNHEGENRFFANGFLTPHSRNTYNKRECIEKKDLEILSYSREAGVYACSTRDYKHIFLSGHSEYQRERLNYEYQRDMKNIPYNYFPNDDPSIKPNFSWKKGRDIFYKRWIDYIKEVKING